MLLYYKVSRALFHNCKLRVDETKQNLFLTKSGINMIPDIIPPGCYPFILVLYTLKCLFIPLRTRGPLWRAIGAVLASPITSPTFFHSM